MKHLKWLLLLAIFIPLLWRPFPLDVNSDTVTINPGLRLVDSKFSLSLDPSAAFANPLVQMGVDFHGIYRQVVFFPVFYFLDVFGVGINRSSVAVTLVAIGFLMSLLNYFFLRSVIGKEKAFWFTLLLSAIPFYGIMAKGGWWHVFVFPFFLAGLAALHKFLNTPPKPPLERGGKQYAYFAIAATLYALSDTGFFFGWFFYGLYALQFYRSMSRSYGAALKKVGRMIWKPWTMLPLATLLGMIAVTVIGFTKFDAEFGILARFLQKGGHVGFTGFDVIPHFLVQAIGLSGWILFPAILIAALFHKKFNEPLMSASFVYFWFVMFANFIAGGNGGAVYVLYAAGLFLLLHAASLIKKSVARYAVLLILLAMTFGQTMWYQFDTQPAGVLAAEFSFVRSSDICQTLWCPWHFAVTKNLGITTLGWVMRDYLSYEPIPFASIKENFYIWPREIYFPNKHGQAPSYSIGRRISYEPRDFDSPRIIIAYTKEALALHPELLSEDKKQQVMSFLIEHPQYKHVATVTVGDVPFIEVFELDSKHEHQDFAVEEYDERFDKRYGNLRDLGHIDVG